MNAHLLRPSSAAALAVLLSGAPLIGSTSGGARPLSVPWARWIAVDAFDPTLGILRAARVDLQSYADGYASAENLEAQPCVAQCRLNASVLLRMPDGTPLCYADHTGTVEMILGAFDGTVDFEGESGSERSIEGLEYRGVVIEDPAILAQFTAQVGEPMEINMPLQAVGSGRMETDGLFATEFHVLAGARVKVVYEYELPEGGSASMTTEN